MPKKRRRRQKLKKPAIAVIFFAVVLLYIAGYTISYLSKEKISVYEVSAGSISTNNVFTGIALREETVFTSDYAGNINYFLRDGQRAAVGTTIYTVDETGRVASMIESLNTGDNSMSAANLSIVRSAMSNYKEDYDDGEFYKLYDLKTKLESTVTDSVNENVINNLDDIIKNTASDNLFKMIKSQKTGVVVYYTDGYENMTVEQLTADSFDKDKYEKNNLRAESITVAGSPVYKQITSEDWSIIIRLNDKMIKDYNLAEKKQVQIRFVKEDITTYANFEIVTTGAGTFGKLTLSKFMIQFANDRFVEIELSVSANSGLKIPTSSVINKEFYTIPVEYATDTSSSKVVFLHEYADSNGKIITESSQYSVYAEIDGLYYVDKDDFSYGDSILTYDSNDRYTVSKTATLEGVYCINTGYAVFKRIERLDENSEYIIVKTGTKYGLSTYDHIILNGSTVAENQIIY
jgi:hypothetical protein